MKMKRNGNGTSDLTVGNPYKGIAFFAFPIFLSQLFQQLYNTADSLIVGRFLGTEALAAVSSSGTLINLMTSFINGTALGASVVIARYFGADDEDKVERSIHTNVAFGLVSGILLTIIGVLFTPTILRWMQTDEEVLPQAILYFRYYYMGSLAVTMYNICCGIMNAIGDSKRPLYYLIFSSCLNVILDILFVGVMHKGVSAAAVATVISQLASVILSLIHLMEKGHIYTIEVRKIRIHRDMFREILNCGLPSGVGNSVIGFANVTVQSQINSFGKLAMAAYGAHAKIEGFTFLPIQSFNMAITTFVSQNLGARQYDRAKKGAKFGIWAAIIMSQSVGILCFIVAPKLIGLFDTTPGVIAIGVQQTRIIAPFYCLQALSHTIASVCRGSGKAFVPMTVMLTVWCVFRLIYIMIVMHLFGSIALVFWAYPITWVISSVIYVIYYFKSDWIHGFEH